MTAVETFANQPTTTVNSPDGTTAPAAGTTETWHVASSASFPAAATGVTQFHVEDVAAGKTGEIILVTNVSGTTWSVTRGAESTTPVAHDGGFTITQVVTAGLLSVLPQSVNGKTGPTITLAASDVGADAAGAATSAQAASLQKSQNLGDVANRQTALDTLAGAVTSGQFLRGNGTHVALAAIQAADLAALSNRQGYAPLVLNPDGSLSFGQPHVFNVLGYGAKGDVRCITDAAITATQTTLTSATAGFTAGDVGKVIEVNGAGSSAFASLITTISAFTNSTTVTLTAAAGTTVSGAWARYGTDDTTAIQSAITAAQAYQNSAFSAGFAKVYFPLHGQGYMVAGALRTGGSTLGNAQLCVTPVAPTTSPGMTLTIEGDSNGTNIPNWLQVTPTLNGTVIHSVGQFASAGAQTTSLVSGVPACLGGPTPEQGWGTLSAGTDTFSDMLIDLRNLQFVTSLNTHGLSFGAFDVSGIQSCHLTNIGYGAFASYATVWNNPASNITALANGGSIGARMPNGSNQQNNVIRGLSVYGGYTYGFQITEHCIADFMQVHYCWCALQALGSGTGSNTRLHSITILQFSTEACTNHIYFLGTTAGGLGGGACLDIWEWDSEQSNTLNLLDSNSGAAIAAATGTIRQTGKPITGVTINGSAISAAHQTGLTILMPWNRGFSTPAVPASTTPLVNSTGFPVFVSITGLGGATVSAITVDGNALATVAVAFVIPPWRSVTLTYSGGTPTWVWTPIG